MLYQEQSSHGVREWRLTAFRGSFLPRVQKAVTIWQMFQSRKLLFSFAVCECRSVFRCVLFLRKSVMPTSSRQPVTRWIISRIVAKSLYIIQVCDSLYCLACLPYRTGLSSPCIYFLTSRFCLRLLRSTQRFNYTWIRAHKML